MNTDVSIPPDSNAKKKTKAAQPVQPQGPIAAVGAAACATVTGSITSHAQHACTDQKPSNLRGYAAGPESHGSSAFA